MIFYRKLALEEIFSAFCLSLPASQGKIRQPNIFASCQPNEKSMKKLPLLGNLTAAQFLSEYWQKKPLLIRQAIPAFVPPLMPKDLFALAANEEVESRLVSQIDGQWQMQNGPFDDDSRPALTQNNWTMLVQGVNLHDDQADSLLRQFSFIDYARLDDLMVSFATDGGGVGPHFDSYDVFLLQAHGERRWRISAQKNLELEEGLPLKILRKFTCEEEFVLQAGDMLYLPPHYAHEGTAIGDCMTYSIGFRSPSFQELGENFLQFMTDSIDLPGMYSDPDLQVAIHPAQISKQMVHKIAEELNKVRFDDEDIVAFLGQYLSEPKPHVYFDPPEKALTAARFAQAAKKRGVRLSRKTQMLYSGNTVFVNGESFEIARADKASILALANERSLNAEGVTAASQDVAEALYVWYQAGWLEVN